MNAILAEIIEAVENDETIVLHMRSGVPGARKIHANAVVLCNYFTDENGGHRIPDADVTAVNVLDRLGDWHRVEIANVVGVELT